MTLRAVGVAIGLAFALASAGWADDLRTTERFNATNVGFEFGEPYRNVTLSVAGPNDFAARAFSKSGAPTIDLRGFGAVRDGSYTYQLTASTDAEVTAEARLNNGRDGVAKATFKSVSASGAFQVKDGVIVERASAKSTGRRDQQ